MARKIRVHELAKDLQINTRDLLNILNEEMGYNFSSLNSLDDDVVKKVLERFNKKEQLKGKEQEIKEKPQKQIKGGPQKEIKEKKSFYEGLSEEEKLFYEELTEEEKLIYEELTEEEKLAEKLKIDTKKLEYDTKEPFFKKTKFPKVEKTYYSKKKEKSDYYKDEFEFVKEEKKSIDNKVIKEVPKEEGEKKVRLTQGLTVKELSEKLKVKETEIIKTLFLKGIISTINQTLELETAKTLAQEFGFTVDIPKSQEVLEEEIISTKLMLTDDDKENLKPRPPVVTVMGHVDHGKTSLLDAIRKTNVIEGEAGGITQHIGAYTVMVQDRKIVFLDTPGHAAFTAMRARGAKVTDVAVVVIAADDGIMPQTVEAINHVIAAGVPIIVAINKIDKENANVERVKQQLTEYNLVPEEWGGDTVVVPVSAKQKIGLDELLEMILLVSDMQELKANPDKPAMGVVVESKLDRGKGPVATVLVQTGTLHIGDNFVVGASYGKVRAMIDDKGTKIDSAGPSTPVEVIGFQGVPQAGDIFQVVESEKKAKFIATNKQLEQKEKEFKVVTRISLDNIYDQIKSGKIKDLNIVIKADVQGSVEALSQALSRLTVEDIKVRIIHAATGDISESDILLASASNALVIGFNVKIDPKAKTLAENENVDVRYYDIIYRVTEDVEKALVGLLEPEVVEVKTGKAEIRDKFKIKGGVAAGCYVLEGKILRNSKALVIRNGDVIFEGKLSSLKRFKEDVKEVNSGYECGISFDKFNDIEIGDIIESYTTEVRKRG